ncbi:hypothetical protein T484DRAFT_1771711 [Baffinella frigidus]|nr:hypothetical protein T484DRAFT_1771711 [Cryptophyta sp. CCMP2293]
MTGAEEVVALLIDKRADVNAKTTLGETPLHAAAHWPGHCEGVVSLLLKHGADPSMRTNTGETPLHAGNQIGVDLSIPPPQD